MFVHCVSLFGYYNLSACQMYVDNDLLNLEAIIRKK